MSFFSDIPIRSNGSAVAVDASWWNTIRTKLVSFFGGGVTAPAEFDIADNQSTYANITGFTLDETTYETYTAEYTIVRTDGTNYRRERGLLHFGYDSQNGWVMERESNFADALNVTDSIKLSGSNVQYKSDSMGGSYAGKFTWKFISTFDTEGV